MNSCQQGRSMIEMLGVLAIVGVLSVGGIAGYSKAMNKAKNNMLISELSELTMNIRTLYTSQTSFAGLNNDVLIKTGFVPKEMLDKTASPSSITHAYGGDVLVYASNTPNGQKNAFEIYFAGISSQACIILSTMDWGQDPASGFQSIYAGVTEITAPLMLDVFFGDDDASLVDQGIHTGGIHENAAPLTVHTATSLCNCKLNECVIGLKYI